MRAHTPPLFCTVCGKLGYHQNRSEGRILSGCAPRFVVCEYMKDYRTFKEDFFKLVEFAEWYKDYTG